MLLVGAIIICVTLHAQAPYPDAELDACNIIWDQPGPNSAASMPIGNGDIGLNVWVEPGGDLLFYIARTDAWGAETRPEWDNWMKTGGVLMKLGAIRLSLDPSPLARGASFRQILHLRQGEIAITEGNTHLRIWVDANHPVIRVEADNPQPVRVKLTLDDWRLGQGDTVLSGKGNTITWYHHNADSADPHLAGRIFGATIEAPGLTRTDRMTLQSTGTADHTGTPGRTGTSGHTLISIYPLTRPSGNVAGWQTGLRQQMESIRRLPLEQTRAAHRAWWDGFWRRSWIFLHGDSAAEKTTQGYILQRYVTACAGRGAYPIKFNGSLFVVDDPARRSHNDPSPVNADFRAWGGQYWFQNTRAMYWPRLQAGDFDMMLPLFAMYRNMLPDNEALVKKYYHHEGAYFQETTPFWGGLPFMGPGQPANYTAHYFTPILELSMMMLDYFDYTGDTLFARDTLLPVASAGIKFFDRHFERDIMSKLLLDPDNAIEMFWKVHDPAPDIAALHAVLSRLIALPDGLASTELRQSWTRLLGELPPLPTGTDEAGEPILLPYTGPQTAKSFNLENPELYAVYPYRLFGLQEPELELARNTFLHRRFRDKGCWAQDPIQAAMLGFTDIAREYTVFNFSRKDPALRFPAFWATGRDYLPDEDNGGNGENALQQMLLQADGRKILLLPAWPDNWDADFRLHAPFHTTIQGKVVHGRLTQLLVTPASRRADVIIRQDPIPFADSKTSWREGYDRFDYLMDELTEEITPTLATPEEGFGARPAEKGKIHCIVIAPKKAAPGNPWSWRGCYWDHEPQSEVELLRRGFHIAFIMCDPDRHWDAWYAFLTEKHGLSKKSAFSGMSRGGINEFAWATTHPDKVACIYADNPALRPESFARLDVLARHDIPLLHICGSYDFLLREHTLKVEDAYHQLGGRISVIIKEGPGHHPHSLRDPRLIADWVENNIHPDGSRPPAIPEASWDKSYYYSYADTLIFLHPEELYATCRGPLFTACYDRYDQNTGSDLAITGMTIVLPKKPAPGKPWVFRAQRIWRQAEPVDLALLARGFTIVAAPVTAQAGPLTEQWDEVYRQLTALGYSSQPVLEGAGTAAGEAVYWALANPGKLSCLYSENPILRSLHTPAPLSDSLELLVKRGVPLVQVHGALPANITPIADSIVASQTIMPPLFSLPFRSRAQNPFITDLYTADPSAHVWKDGRLYVYPSHDIAPPRGCDLMDKYHVYSTDDMVHWKDHGQVLEASQVSWGRPEGGFMWAPDCAYKNGTYYFYFPHPSGSGKEWNSTWKIGVATSREPAANFKLQGYIQGLKPMIDPCIFVDDDGQAYLYYGGGGKCEGVKLKDNMMEIDGPTQPMVGLHDFHEATWVHRRKGIYYLSYSDNYRDSTGQHNRMNYATSNSPLGPWKYQGIYLDPTDCDTDHGSIVEYKGQWYAFYHNSVLSHRGNLRSICVDKLFYNPDGTIQKVIQTTTGPGPVGAGATGAVPATSGQGIRYPSYTGLVMAGYQGWFNTPGDSTGRHWHHYERRGVFAPGSCEIDLWPDMREYAKTYPTPFHYADGTQATVFSAYDASTVRLHFKWMKDYGIDGAFIQRFVAEIRNPGGRRHFNTVLDNAMTAAGEYDRAICIMYDLSGMQPGEEQLTLADLDELTARYDLLHGTRSPTYLHHHGRPLVVVWGVGFNDNRRYGFREAETLIDGIRSRGFSVMLGVPTYWRTLGRDCLPDSALYRLIRKCDIVAPWFVGRYNEDSYPAFRSLLKDDLVWCRDNGVDYAPLAFPGFSWKNMNGPQSTAIPRNRGHFFWEQVAGAREAGAAMLYIAMFDEMNEGTSIFKCNTADRLPLNEGGSFVGIDTDLGSDYYLWLAGQAAAWWHGKDSYSSELPRRL